MSGVYGSFLNKESPYCKRYLNRVDSLSHAANLYLSDVTTTYPNLKDLVSVSHPNIMLATGRYFNDLVRIKELHNIKILHRSKIVSHSLKWLITNPAIAVSATKEQYIELSYDERLILLSINTSFLNILIHYFLKGNWVSLKPSENETVYKVLKDLSYHINTNSYEEHIVGLLIKTLMD